MLGEQGRFLLMGGAFGLFCAVLGAAVEFVLARRRKDEDDLPGCMMLIAGALVVIGLVAISASFFLGGKILTPIVVGVGVVFGFWFGFSILFVLGIFLSSREADFWE